MGEHKGKYAIGIDLGTTFSCVGVYMNNKVEIIANDQGNRTTPSYVAFNETERLIGDSAKNQATINHDNTLFDAKRLIGRKSNDHAIQNDIKFWPFKIIEKNKNRKSRLNNKNKKHSNMKPRARNNSKRRNNTKNKSI